MLTRFRSPRALSSWLVGLVAVPDSAALWLALAPGSAPAVECRLCLRMGFTALQVIGEVVGLAVDGDPDPDAPLQLTWEEYLTGVDRLRSAGFRVERSPEEAFPGLPRLAGQRRGGRARAGPADRRGACAVDRAGPRWWGEHGAGASGEPGSHAVRAAGAGAGAEPEPEPESGRGTGTGTWTGPGTGLSRCRRGASSGPDVRRGAGAGASVHAGTALCGR